jgi:hypothetical protein
VGLPVAIWLLGFTIAIPLTTFFYLVTAREKWPLSVVLTVLTWGFVYGLFDRLLRVPFPEAQLFLWLGWVSG